MEHNSLTTAMSDQTKSLNISKSTDVTENLPGFLNSAPKIHKRALKNVSKPKLCYVVLLVLVE